MEFDECLIELVRNRQELYDMSGRRYSDAVRKEAIWREIGDEMGRPGPECKRRWISLRDQFRKNVNRKTKSGQATVSKKRWKYEEIMAFLQPFLLERETLTNITVLNTGEEAEEEELEEDLSEPFPSSLHNVSSAESSSTSSLPAVQASSTRSTPSSRQRGVKRKQPGESAASTLMQYLLASQVKDDHIDNFMASIGASIKRLSAMRQLQAKNKLYNLVSSMELEQLLEDTENGS